MKTTVRRLVLFFCVCFIGLAIEGCGEKYSKQGNLLYNKIYEHLMERRICPTVEECKAELEINGTYRNQVSFTVNSSKNRKAALAVFTEFVVENGIKITGGVPIEISIYVKPGDGSEGSFFGGKTVIKMEITQ